MTQPVLRVAAPRLLTVKNRLALLHHVLDRVDEGVRDVVISLANTTYVDSTGLAMLADLHRVLVRELGGRLRVCGACPDLALLLHVTRLDARIEVVNEVEDVRGHCLDTGEVLSADSPAARGALAQLDGDEDARLAA